LAELIRRSRTFGALIGLEDLDLEGNQLYSFPSMVVKELTRLARLNLANNVITRFPDIGCLVELVDLSLENNQLTTLPHGLANCSNLKYLNISKNRISDISQIGNLLKLSELNLGYNNIMGLPDGIGNCYELRRLLGPYNKISDIPSTVWKCKMVHFSFHFSPSTSFRSLFFDFPSNVVGGAGL